MALLGGLRPVRVGLDHLASSFAKEANQVHRSGLDAEGISAICFARLPVLLPTWIPPMARCPPGPK